MKSQEYKDGDDDNDDLIRLDYGPTASRLENVKFLDPGIIDLDCVSDVDCKYIDDDTTDIILEEASCSPTSTAAPNQVIVKSMCIKLVDCFKFPWYFNEHTKYIIAKKLNINNSGDIIDKQVDNPKMFRNLSDKHEIIHDSNSDCKVANNIITGSTVTDDFNKSKNENEQWLNKKSNMECVHEVFTSPVRVLDTKSFENYNKRNDMEILSAMRQRNKTGIDLKRNIGLVGMKIQRLKDKKSTMETKDKPEIQLNATKISNEQGILNNLYVQAIGSASANIGTNTTSIFNEATEDKISKPNKCKPQDINSIPSQKEFQSFICNEILENDESNKDFKFKLAQKDDEKEMSSRINKITKIAEEIVQIVTSHNKEKFNIHDKHTHPKDVKKKVCKAMPHSKKIENERKKMLLNETVNSLEQQNNTEGCRMAKLINPIPLPSRGQKNENIKFGAHESQSQNITSTVLDNDTYMPNKSFTTLNKFTENIFNKIQAKQRQQSKFKKTMRQTIDKTIEKLYKNRMKTTKTVDQEKSTDECKLVSSDCITRANMVKDLFSDSNDLIADTKVSETVNSACPNMSRSLLKKSKTNNSDLSRKKTDSLPLNTIIMKTPKTDDAKIYNDSIINVENIANSINPLSQFNITDQLSQLTKTNTKESQWQTSKIVSPVDVRNPENPLKNKMNSQTVRILAEQSPPIDQTVNDNITIQTIITSRNELDAWKQSYFQTPNNSVVHTHKPKAQVPAIIRPTEAQAKKKSLTVHNSLQSHILYKPQVGNQPGHQMFSNNPEVLQYQPVQNMNPQFYQQSWYTDKKEITGDIPSQMVPKTIPSEHIRASSLNTIMKAKSPRGEFIPKMMTLNSTMMLSSVNRHNLTQIEINASPLGNNRMSPRTAMNRLQFFPVANESPQMRMTANVPGANGGTLPQMAIADRSVSRGFPPQMAIHERFRPPGVCDVQPSNVFWSYPFPPPVPPPPPPPPLVPTYQETTKPQTVDSSIIGRNNDGIVKKINITTPSVLYNKQVDIKESEVRNENSQSDSTPLYDEVSTDIQETCTLVNTKSEMIRVLDTSMKQLRSPVKHSEGIFSTLSSPSIDNYSKKSLPCKPISSKDSRTALPLQNDKIPVNNPKHEVLQKMIPKKISATNSKVSQPRELNESTFNNSKKTMPVEPSKSCATQSKVLQTKPNQSLVPNLTRVMPFSQQFEDNSKPLDNTGKIINCESKLNQITYSNTPINSKKVIISSHERKPRNTENNRSPNDISKRDNASTANINRTIPINETKCVSTNKYKPGPLSKKMKYNDPVESQTKNKEKTLPNKGYSSPILPIPTYENILAYASFDDTPEEKFKKLFSETKKTKIANNMDSKRPIKKRKHYEQNSNNIDSSKKISLDEYKKRTTGERRKDEEARDIHTKQNATHNNNVNMLRRASYIDSDLGYDSDSTVKL